MSDPMWWALLAVGYLCGATPFALLLGLAHGVDVRKVGSGNVGATNLGRALGKKWGVICFLLDAGKGLLPVLLAGLVMHWFGVGWASDGQMTTPDMPGATGAEASRGHEAWLWLAIGAAAILGHMFPIWLGFKGGKGVATGFGAMLGVWPTLTLPCLAALLTWAVVVAVSRYVSLASMVAAASIPIYLILLSVIREVSLSRLTPFLVVTSVIAILVIVRHRANITRLLAGTESKLGQKKVK